MDGGRLRAVSRVRDRSVSGVLRAVVPYPQGAARRLLDDALPPPPEHLAQFLPARSPGRLGGLPHLRAVGQRGAAMTIRLITPAPAHSRKGNRVTALRWAPILRELGHRVTIEQTYEGGRCDLMVALHARRSYASIDRFHRDCPDRPLIVALTGTDLYQDIRTSRRAQRSLDLATRLVLLQPCGIEELPPALQGKARVIYQSAVGPRQQARPASGTFEVCVLGHLRPVKDPFRTAMAVRRLPATSRIRVLHVGAALSDE